MRALLPLTLLALALAVGCGQKGPLVHPNKHPKTPVATDASGAARATPPTPAPAAPGAAPPRESSDAPAATPRG